MKHGDLKKVLSILGFGILVIIVVGLFSFLLLMAILFILA